MEIRKLPTGPLMLLLMVLIIQTATFSLAQSLGHTCPTLIVYSNGYVQVKEVVTVENSSVVSVELLGKHVEGVSVTYQNGTPIPFEIGNGTLIAFPERNTSELNVSYYTPDLTSKRGIVWTLRVVNMSTPFRVVLPKDAVIVDLSTIPLQIHGNVIVMPKGNQNVSYIIQYVTNTSTGTTSTGTTGTSTTGSQTGSSSTSGHSSSVTGTSSIISTGTSSSSNNQTAPVIPASHSKGVSFLWVIPVVVAIVATASVLVYLRKRGNMKGASRLPGRDEFIEMLNDPSLNLNEEEKEALLYVYDRGGLATQAEVRDALGLPKTTAWRMFKRLEDRGLVRIIKRRKENLVELRWKSNK